MKDVRRQWLAIPALTVALFCASSSAQHADTSAQAGRTDQVSQRMADNQDDVAAIKADLAKMHALLNQMEATFPLVGSTTEPVNHELELNIEMWRALLAHMDRGVQHMERNQTSRHPDQK